MAIFYKDGLSSERSLITKIILGNKFNISFLKFLKILLLIVLEINQSKSEHTFYHKNRKDRSRKKSDRFSEQTICGCGIFGCDTEQF
jgi:hypothetical protein